VTTAQVREEILRIGDQYIADPEFRLTSTDRLRLLREECPVHRTTSGTWLVTSYNDLRTVLRDPQTFSRAEAAKRHTMIRPGPAREYFTAKMLWRDGKDHARLRRLVTTAFTVNGIKRWEPMIQEIADELLASAYEHHGMDVVSDFSLPLSERIICRLLGVPYEDHLLWESWVARVLEPAAGADDRPYREASAQAMLEFADYILEIVHERRRKGVAGDDLLDRLMHAESGTDAILSETELVALCLEFIGAGHETTAHFISTAVWVLLTHQDQLEALRQAPTLLDGAIDETLRLLGPAIITLPRVTTATTAIAGVTIPAGETVVCLQDSADRDPAVFDSPDNFDIHRSPNPHVAFGSGPHLCIGKNLAWAESRIALASVVERLPGLALDPATPAVWEPHRYLRALSTLPVVW
jgi:cytochrome P450